MSFCVPASYIASAITAGTMAIVQSIIPSLVGAINRVRTANTDDNMLCTESAKVSRDLFAGARVMEVQERMDQALDRLERCQELNTALIHRWFSMLENKVS